MAASPPLIYPGGRRAVSGAAPPASRLLAHRLRRRPCGPAWTPETSATPGRQASRARPGACPCPRTAPCRRPPHMVNTERGIYRHCCNDPLSPRTWMWHPRCIRGAGARGGSESLVTRMLRERRSTKGHGPAPFRRPMTRKIAIWSQRRRGDHFPPYDARVRRGRARGPGRGQPQIGDHEVPIRARIRASAIR